MYIDRFDDRGEADRQQVQTLCDDLHERAETMEQEQVLLAQLSMATEGIRPNRASRYRAMLASVRMRYAQLQQVIARYCR